MLTCIPINIDLCVTKKSTTETIRSVSHLHMWFGLQTTSLTDAASTFSIINGSQIHDGIFGTIIESKFRLL